MNARYTGDRATGFASPASDSVEGPIDLSQTLDLMNPSRYPVRVRGATFAARGILDGDILIADTAGSPQAGQLVIAWAAGRVLLVELQKWGNTWWLVSGDNTHPPLRLILHGIWKSGPLLPAWCVRGLDVIVVITAVPDDPFCLFWHIRQQHISTSEITDLPCGQMKADRTAFTVTYSV